MLDFNLPLLSGDVVVKEAFAPMSQQNVSGLVVSVGSEYRLLEPDWAS